MLRQLSICLAITLCACQAPSRLTVMSYNIHHGRGIDEQVDLSRIAEVILASGADLVALQEVDVGTARTDQRALAGELAELCGMTRVFGKNIDYQGGDYGNAILSRLPILWSQNHHYDMIRVGEQRGLLQVVVELDGREVGFFTTHIDYRPDDTERIKHMAEIDRVRGGHSDLPVILCGDFNDTPGSRTHAASRQEWIDAWESVGTGSGFTFPSETAAKRIDYVFLSRGRGLTPLRSWIPMSLASDHRPLVLELLLN